MKCPNCGADLEADAKFCTNCGKETIPATQTVVPAAPTLAVQTSIPTPQPVGTVPVQQKKNNNTLLIVLGVVIGVIVLFGVGGLLIIRTVFNSISDEIANYEDSPSIYDYSNSGKEVKKIKDPTGREIVLVEDSINIIKVDTGYLYDKAEEMRKSAKRLTNDEIDALNATDLEKLATKKAVKSLTYSSYSKKELESSLEGESYNAATIKFAIEHCGADWDEQAKLEAYEILGAGGDSKEELISLLVFRGFDEAKVKKIVEQEKFDFYEQAVSDACFYKYAYKNYGGAKTRDEAEKLLKFNNYSEAEVRFALKAVYDDLDY